MQLLINSTSTNLKSTAKKAVDKTIPRELNKIAFAAQQAVRQKLGRTFTLRSRFVESGIRYEKATESNPVARIYSSNDFLAIHEEGGTIESSGKKFAVPTGIRITKASSIPKNRRASQIVKKKNVFVNKGNTAILQKMSGSLKPLYTLTKSVSYKPTLGFKKTVEIAMNLEVKR